MKNTYPAYLKILIAFWVSRPITTALTYKNQVFLFTKYLMEKTLLSPFFVLINSFKLNIQQGPLSIISYSYKKSYYE
jgi:hypothetical protein